MNNITAIIPISPMPSHPDTYVLDEVIKSVRERLPDSEIILMFDGVSPTLMHLKEKYEQYIQIMLHKANFEQSNIVPIVFDKHQHQSLMLKEALRLVRTSQVLWLEQDTPLHNEIPFNELSKVIDAGYANAIRFHFEAHVHPEHEYLMLDQAPIDILGQPFLRTRQWSGRPHLASTEWYREIANKYFDDQPRFIEHILYGPIVEGDFNEFRLHMYAPKGTLVRSRHLDGRRIGAENYDPNPS